MLIRVVLPSDMCGLVTWRTLAPLSWTAKNRAVRRLRYAAPQFRREIADGLDRARQRLAHARIEGVDWYWPPDEAADEVLAHLFHVAGFLF